MPPVGKREEMLRNGHGNNQRRATCSAPLRLTDHRPVQPRPKP
jgi:hypothetical protein